MSPVVFSLTYLVSWLLMGLGVFLTFRLVSHLRQGAQVAVPAERGGKTAVAPLVTIALAALVVLVSLGVFYAGAYTFYNLIVVP